MESNRSFCSVPSKKGGAEQAYRLVGSPNTSLVYAWRAERHRGRTPLFLPGYLQSNASDEMLGNPCAVQKKDDAPTGNEFVV